MAGGPLLEALAVTPAVACLRHVQGGGRSLPSPLWRTGRGGGGVLASQAEYMAGISHLSSERHRVRGACRMNAVSTVRDW